MSAAIWTRTASIWPLSDRCAPQVCLLCSTLSLRRASRYCSCRRISYPPGRLGHRSESCSAEQAKKSLEQQATLGRYMLDVRHTLNNSLTSVLGNSELLVLDPGSLSAAERSQIETIRNMAVRMHEILRRFSSIEKELNAVEKQAENEARTKSRAATATS